MKKASPLVPMSTWRTPWDLRKELLNWLRGRTVSGKNSQLSSETETASLWSGQWTMRPNFRTCPDSKTQNWDLSSWNWSRIWEVKFSTRPRRRHSRGSHVLLPCSLNCVSIFAQPLTMEVCLKFRAIGTWSVNQNLPESKKVIVFSFRMSIRVWKSS